MMTIVMMGIYWRWDFCSPWQAQKESSNHNPFINTCHYLVDFGRCLLIFRPGYLNHMSLFNLESQASRSSISIRELRRKITLSRSLKKTWKLTRPYKVNQQAHFSMTRMLTWTKILLKLIGNCLTCSWFMKIPLHHQRISIIYQVICRLSQTFI